jgi:hypothetical protein
MLEAMARAGSHEVGCLELDVIIGHENNSFDIDVHWSLRELIADELIQDPGRLCLRLGKVDLSPT